MRIAATASYRMNVFVNQERSVIHTKFVDHRNVTHAQIQNAALEPNAIKSADELIAFARSVSLEIHLLNAVI